MPQEKLAYIKHDRKTSLAVVKEWKVYEGDQGCTPVTLEGICLRTDRAPPPLPGPQTESKAPASAVTAPTPKASPVAAPAKTEAARKGPMLALLEWAASEPPAKVQNLESKKEQTIPPFDLRDVPKAMEVMGWKIAAKLSQRWLDGRAYDAYPDGKNERQYYDKDMVDADTVKLSWLLKQSDIRTHYEDLITESIYSSGAVKILKGGIFTAFFSKDRWFRGDLDPLQYCGGDLQKMHRLFQFQYEGVSTLDGLSPKEWQRKGITEITAALGSFNFYAAVGKAKVTMIQYKRYNTPQGDLTCTQSKVEITMFMSMPVTAIPSMMPRAEHRNIWGIGIKQESLAYWLPLPQGQP